MGGKPKKNLPAATRAKIVAAIRKGKPAREALRDALQAARKLKK